MKWAIITIISLLLVACSGQQAGDTIKIGFIGPLTGDVAVYGIPARESVELAAKIANDAGGINGKQVQVIYEDSQCLGKEGVVAMNKLVSVDNVKGVIAELCSAVAMPTYPIAEEAEVVMIGYGASNPDLTPDTPYFFRTFPSDALQGKIAAELSVGAGHKNIAIIYLNDDYGNGFKDSYTKRIEELEGAKIVAVEAFAKGDVDFRTQIEKVKGADPDLIFLISFPKEGGLVIKQLRESGVEIPIRGGEANNDPALIEAAGEAAEGFKLTWPKAGEGKTVDAYKSGYSEMFGKEPGVFGATAYDALNIMINAMRKCGVDDYIECIENMESHDGASGTVVFDEFGDVIQEYDVFEVQNGELVII